MIWRIKLCLPPLAALNAPTRRECTAGDGIVMYRLVPARSHQSSDVIELSRIVLEKLDAIVER